MTKSFRPPRAREEDVVALQIAVHDAEVVGARERGAHLLEDVDGARERHRAARELVRERRADEVLHDEVELAVVGLADVVDVDDVRVVDAVGGARFAQHPRAQVRLAAQVGADQLDRDDAIDEHVTGAVDDAHAAFADPRLEPIAPGNDPPERRIVVFPGSGCPCLQRRCLCHAMKRSLGRLEIILADHEELRDSEVRAIFSAALRLEEGGTRSVESQKRTLRTGR